MDHQPWIVFAQAATILSPVDLLDGRATAGYVLALLAGGLIGFCWSLGIASDSKARQILFGAKPISLVVSSGTLFLGYWNVTGIGPVHGVCWLLGTIFGMWLAHESAVRHYSAGVSGLPPSLVPEFKGLVRRSILQLGHNDLERTIDKYLAKQEKNESRFLNDAIAELHDFVHTARDDAVQYMAEYDDSVGEFLQDKDFPAFQLRVADQFRRYLTSNLVAVVNMFEALTGRTRKLWVAVRVLKTQTLMYETIVRVGKYARDRGQRSVPIPKDTGLPAYLRLKYDSNEGVVFLTPDSRTSETWTSTVNDRLGDDQSTIAGPIIVKSGNPKGRHAHELFMILYVNSPEKNAFSERYNNYMRCCTDVLSLFFSMANKLMEGTGVEPVRLDKPENKA